MYYNAKKNHKTGAHEPSKRTDEITLVFLGFEGFHVLKIKHSM